MGISWIPDGLGDAATTARWAKKKYQLTQPIAATPPTRTTMRSIEKEVTLSLLVS
jgi:hypothetical protein